MKLEGRKKNSPRRSSNRVKTNKYTKMTAPYLGAMVLLCVVLSATLVQTELEKKSGPGWISNAKCPAVQKVKRSSAWWAYLLPQQSGPFVIERNGWASQDIVVEIARILLESRNYEVVIQYQRSTGFDKYKRLVDGTTDFNMEMWHESSRLVEALESSLDCSIANAQRGELCAVDLGSIGCEHM